MTLALGFLSLKQVMNLKGSDILLTIYLLDYKLPLIAKVALALMQHINYEHHLQHYLDK